MDRIEVALPSGHKQLLTGVLPNQIPRVTEPK
jgi:hypothetical protein